MNSNYELIGNADNWSLFVAKKNGKPKTDYPGKIYYYISF